jgi:hypothetical protein
MSDEGFGEGYDGMHMVSAKSNAIGRYPSIRMLFDLLACKCLQGLDERPVLTRQGMRQVR